uniref:Uncharacterized protein n=1 Tax=Aotus nancymaae TaxID=37293 RepID=A0A2K5EAP4_AOTNA
KSVLGNISNLAKLTQYQPSYTLGQLQNCVVGIFFLTFLYLISTIIDSLTEHLLGVRHCATRFPWGLPSSS